MTDKESINNNVEFLELLASISLKTVWVYSKASSHPATVDTALRTLCIFYQDACMKTFMELFMKITLSSTHV